MITPTPLNLLIVDDSELVRLGLKVVLEAQARTGNFLLKVIGEAGTVAAAITEAARLEPDVILMDIRLPDGSGLEACRRLIASGSASKVLILTSILDDNMVNEALHSGAGGYLLKEINATALCQAIIDVAAGKFILDPKITTRLFTQVRTANAPTNEAGKLAILSPQELRVIALVAEGRTNLEIATKMELSDKTVKNYLHAAFQKLQVTRRSQAAVFYLKYRRATEDSG